MSKRKTGVLTLSLGLIISGIFMILFQMDLVSAELFKSIGPIFLILFGLEIIWKRLRHSDQPARISGWSVAFIILILIVSLSQTTSATDVLWQNRYFSPVNGEVPLDTAVKQVDIRIPDGKIIVTGTDKAVLSYDGELTAYGSSQSQADEKIEANWTVRTSGDTIELILETPGITFSLSQLYQWNFQTPVLHVEVPQALLTKVRTSNGKIDISNMNADVELKTSNGAIEVRNINGNVNAETSNGLIKGESAVNGNWNLKTSNGKINMTFPANTNATVQGKTSNGSIGGNIEWQDDRKNNRTAVLGTGENTVTLSTSNGSISVNASP